MALWQYFTENELIKIYMNYVVKSWIWPLHISDFEKVIIISLQKIQYELYISKNYTSVKIIHQYELHIGMNYTTHQYELYISMNYTLVWIINQYELNISMNYTSAWIIHQYCPMYDINIKYTSTMLVQKSCMLYWRYHG